MFKDFFYSKKAVLLDLDGTVVESHPIWNVACAEVAANLGFDWRGADFFTEPSLEEVWRSYLDYTGENYGVPISSLVTQTKDKFLTIFLKFVPEDILKPGFWSFINEIKSEKEMRVGLVTNSDRDVTEKMLDHLNIRSAFEVVICGSDVKKKKPDSEIYEKAIKALGLKAKEILCFEDAPAGVKSARGAGLKVIGVMNRLYPEKDYPSDLTIVDDFAVFHGRLDKTPKEVLQEMLSRPLEEESADDQQ
jgi:HAD superfamily hydrolase (TIGR01509 family)